MKKGYRKRPETGMQLTQQKSLNPQAAIEDGRRLLEELETRPPYYFEEWNDLEDRAYIPGAGATPVPPAIDDPKISKKHRSAKSGSMAHRAMTGPLASKGSGDTDEFAYNDVMQGNLGDCWFLAAIGALALNDPDTLRNMIKDNGDGTYDVTLYVKNGLFNKRHQEVITVDAEFVQYTTGSHAGSVAYNQPGDSGELWVMIIEKAYAQSQGSYHSIEGGYASVGMEILTGRNAKKKFLIFMSEQKILETIHEAVGKQTPITAGSQQNSTKGMDRLGLVSGHAYVVTGVDVGKKEVNLYNPWGVDVPYVKKGVNYTTLKEVTLSVDDFKRYFSTLEMME